MDFVCICGFRTPLMSAYELHRCALVAGPPLRATEAMERDRLYGLQWRRERAEDQAEYGRRYVAEVERYAQKVAQLFKDRDREPVRQPAAEASALHRALSRHAVHANPRTPNQVFWERLPRNKKS